MAVTVVNNLSLIDAADATTGWTSDGDTVAAYSGFQREGSACLGIQISQTTSHVTFAIASTDLQNTRVYAWVQAWGSVATKANGGFRIVLGDGTNRRAYYVGGSDDYGFQVGAWTCMVLDTANLPTDFAQLAGSNAPNLAAITVVGNGANFSNKAVGNVDNYFWDVHRHGLGITVYGGTSADPGVFSEIAADDASTAAGKAYGIIREVGAGVFGVQGDILFGDDAGTNDFYFKDDSATVFIEDRVHGPGTPTDIRIHVRGNATATTQHFELGAAVGTGDDQTGRNGITFLNTNINQPVTFDASDADLDDLLMYGCTLDGIGKSGTVSPSFSADATLGVTHVISGCTFTRCGQVDLGVVVTRNCIFTGHTGTNAALLWNENIDIKKCQFLSNTDPTNDPAGIEHAVTTGTPFTYDGLTFSGNDFDIYNSSGGDITINATNGSDPSTHRTPAGSTTINNTVTLTVTVKFGTVPVEGMRVRIEETNGTLISEGTTNASGVFSDSTYNYPGSPVNVTVIARLKGFRNAEIADTIDSGGLATPVSARFDPTVNLP